MKVEPKLYGSQSMTGPLRRVLVRAPHAEDLHGWQNCGWRAEPDPAALSREHEAFCAILEAAGAEVVLAESPAQGNPDSIYTYDPALVSDEGALMEAAHEHPAEQTTWREEIDRALQRLRPEQREAFVLKYVEEMGYDEMSQLTGVGVSALKMRVMRACERHRELLSEVHSA